MIELIRKKQRYNLDRLKDFQIKIYHLFKMLFYDTPLVDDDALYQIDPEYEVHNRNLRKQATVVVDQKKKGAGKRASQSINKSASPSKIPAASDAQKAKRNYGFVKKTKAQTFLKYDNQKECVDILMRQYERATDKDAPELSEKEKLKEEKLYKKSLEPYLRHEN